MDTIPEQIKHSAPYGLWPQHGGRVGQLISSHDWNSTPLGPIDAWPHSLKTVVDLMLASRLAMCLLWGRDEILLYNDDFSALIGNRQFNILGRRISEVFAEARLAFDPQLAQVWSGKPLQLTDQSYTFLRNDVLEEAWFDVSSSPVRDECGEIAGVLCILTETTTRVIAERARAAAEAAQRDSEARQTYLHRLGEALSLLRDAVEIQATAARMLGERLSANRVLYAEIIDEREVVISQDFVNGVASIAGRYQAEQFVSETVASLRRGEALIFNDVATDPALSDATRHLFSAMEIGSAVGLSLIKGGRLVAGFAVQSKTPRVWTELEISLIEETAERTWAAVERTHAEQAQQASERRFQRTLETDAVGVIFLDHSGTVVEANDVFLRMTGYTDAQIERRELTWRGMTPLDWTEVTERQMEQLGATGRMGPYEKEYFLADGSRRSMLFAGRDLGDGTIAKYCIDITERKHAEAAVRENEQKYRSLFNTMAEGFGVCELIRDEAGRAVDFLWLDLNPQLERLTGLKHEQLIGQRASQALPGQDGSWLRICERVVDTGESTRVEQYVEQIDRWLDCMVSPYGGDRFSVLYDDITERKRVEEALRRSEERQAFLLKLSDALRPLQDPMHVQAEASRVLCEHLRASGVSYGEVDSDGRTVGIKSDYCSPGDPSAVGVDFFHSLGSQAVESMFAGRTVVITDIGLAADLNARERVVHSQAGAAAYVSVPLVKAGRLCAFLTVHQAVPRNWTPTEVSLIEETAERTWAAVERAQAEEALRAREEKYRILFESIDEGFAIIELICDENGKAVDYWIRESNPAQEKMIRSGLAGKRIREIIPEMEEAWIGKYAEVARTGEPTRFEEYLQPLERWFDTHVSRIGGEDSRLLALIYHDITDRKGSEASLRESEARQAFLVRLGDALRSLSSPVDIQAASSRLLGQHLDVARCYYYEYDECRGKGVIHRDYVRAGETSLVGAYHFEDFPAAHEISRGHTLVISDTANCPLLTAKERVSYPALGIVADIVVSLVKGGILRGAFAVTESSPREWTSSEIALVEEVAERTWAAVERARAEAALRESEERFRLFVENVREYALFQTDNQGVITTWNPGAERLFGYTSSQVLGQPAAHLLTKDDQDARILELETTRVMEGERRHDARWLVRKDGVRFWAQWVAEPVRDETGQLRGVARILRDETERRNADEALKQSLAEKEELLKEVHHRVKNNLQVITSLLNLQARQIDDDKTLGQFEIARNRVQSIASIHEQLYRSRSFAAIELLPYAQKLVADVVRFYDAQERIQVEVLGDGASLELQRAVPFGLLLNELVSNSCKHAFPDGRQGRLTVEVGREDCQIILTVTDTGVGLPADFDHNSLASLGIFLVHSLARQLQATVTFKSDRGLTVHLRLPVTVAEELEDEE